MKKFVIAFCILSLVLLFSSCVSGASGNPPEIDEVKDTFVQIIEESKEFNVIFFGEGLPTYRRDSDLSEAKHIYAQGGISGFEYIMENAGYYSVENIVDRADRVFGSDYLKDISGGAFDGIYVDNINNMYLRFYEDADWIYQSTLENPVQVTEERIYDYSSMEIVQPSSENFVTVKIRSYSMATPGDWKEFNLSFVCENGRWYLDSPTY